MDAIEAGVFGAYCFYVRKCSKIFDSAGCQKGNFEVTKARVTELATLEMTVNVLIAQLELIFCRGVGANRYGHGGGKLESKGLRVREIALLS